MNLATRVAYDQNRNFDGKAFRAACYAPFTTLEFNVNGEVVACWKSARYVLGRIGESSLDEIWKGEALRNMRTRLLNYDFPEECEWCAWQMRAGDLTDILARRYDFLDVEPESQWPQQFYFNLGNECNYACIMCSGEVSSAYRKHIEGRPRKPIIYTNQFFEQLDRFLPHIRHASFFGGEPFLTPGNYRVWDRLVEINPAARIHINTNGSVLSQRVKDYLGRLNVGSMAVSIDGATKETFERVRRFSKYEVVMKNLEYFSCQAKALGWDFQIVACVLRENFHELPQIYELAVRLGARVTLNMVTYPEEHSVYTLPRDERLHIHVYLHRAYTRLREQLNPASQISYEGLLKRLSGEESWSLGPHSGSLNTTATAI
ncbi:MAG: twitch domain-containing radical SAM protein [Candidatus Omnitrophica bacterium]|nr:twitch domain-containing radical SAM protein [Candidatus Omnitrophota bacterium]